MAAPFHIGQRPQNILFVGDSLFSFNGTEDGTATSIPNTSIPELYEWAGGNIQTVANSGLTLGYWVLNMQAAIQAADPTPNIVIVNAGINEFIVEGATLAQLQARLDLCIDVAYQNNCYMAYIGIVPCRSTSTISESEYADILTFNAWAENTCISRGVAYVDPFPYLENPATPGDKFELYRAGVGGSDYTHHSISGQYRYLDAIYALSQYSWNTEGRAAQADAEWA